MILEKGDMWSIFGKTDMFVITTNPIIRKDGAVVMGRGIAKQMKDRFPEFPFKLAERYTKSVDTQAYDDALHPVNTGFVGGFDGQACGWFMVKDHWREPAKLEIIQRSVKELINSLTFRGFDSWYIPKTIRYDLNFPGIGNGKLAREDVLPIIEQLPDNVHIWEYKE